MSNSLPVAKPAPPVSRRRYRQEACQALLICSALLILSLVLKPDPRGYGTHQQLLMPPCFFRLVTTLPCPFCGMTTGFVHMAHGQVRAAAAANLMAPPAFVATVVLALLGLWGVLTNREWLPLFFRRPGLPRALAAVIVLFWAVNLIRHYL